MTNMYKAANASHQWVRESTQRAITQPWGSMGALRGVDTYDDKLYRWSKAHGWSPKVHHEGEHHDVWICGARLEMVHRKTLVVVGLGAKGGDSRHARASTVGRACRNGPPAR